MDFSRDIAMGFLTNSIPRILNQMGTEEGQLFTHTILTERLRGVDLPNLDELINRGDPKIWKNISKNG
jgi:hypothetical protein